MSQLELFAPSHKETAEKKAPVKPEPLADVTADNIALEADDAADLEPVAVTAAETPPGATALISSPARDIIFSDDKISVKIKRKKVEEAVENAVATKPARVPQKRGRKPLKELPGDIDPIEVPEDEELFKKQYYPISVVAQWFKVNTSLLRFWENEFDILKPRKNRKGDRLFRPEDIKNLQLIHHLLRHRKYSIEGAKEFLKGDKEKADAQLQITKTLLKLKGFLLGLKASL